MSSADDILDTCCANYEVVPAVSSIRALPRFSLPKNITLVFSDDPQQQQAYIWGAVLLAIVIFITLLVWIIVLLIFPCMGPQKVGFLSGARLLGSKNGTDGPLNKRPRRVRITFLIAAALVVAFTITLGLLGIRNLHKTTTSVYTTMDDVQDIVGDVQGTLTNLTSQFQEAEAALDNVLLGLADFCAGDTVLSQQAAQLATSLAQVDNLNIAALDNLDTTLTSLSATTEQAQEVVQKVDQGLVFALVYRVPLIVLSCILMIGAFKAWRGNNSRCFERSLQWFFMPLFALFVATSWILAIVFAVIAVVNADACAGSGNGGQGSPSQTIAAAFSSGNADDDVSDLLQQLVSYYFGCNKDHPFHYITEYELELDGAIDATNEFLSQIANVSEAVLNQACGANVTLTGNNVRAILQLTVVVKVAVFNMLALVSCSTITPLYNQVVNDTVCDYNVSAMAWTFGSLIVIALSGMTMITLRSAIFSDQLGGGERGAGGEAAEVVSDMKMAQSAVPLEEEQAGSQPQAQSQSLDQDAEQAMGGVEEKDQPTMDVSSLPPVPVPSENDEVLREKDDGLDESITPVPVPVRSTDDEADEVDRSSFSPGQEPANGVPPSPSMPPEGQEPRDGQDSLVDWDSLPVSSGSETMEIVSLPGHVTDKPPSP